MGWTGKKPTITLHYSAFSSASSLTEKRCWTVGRNQNSMGCRHIDVALEDVKNLLQRRMPTAMGNLMKRHIRRGAKINSAFGYLPYGWSEENEVVTFDRSVKKRRIYLFQVFLYWTYVAFLSFRALYVTYIDSSGMSNSGRTYLQFSAVAHFGIVPFQICTLTFYGRLHVIINRYLAFQTELRAEWTARWKGKKFKSAHKFGRGMMILGSANTISNVMRIWRNPKAGNLITAVIPNLGKIAKWKLLPLAVVQFLHAAHTWVMAYLFMTFIMGLMADVSNKLELMR